MLLVAGEVELADEREDHADRVLGHRHRVNSAAVRDHDVALDQLGKEEVADAGRCHLDPAQALRSTEVVATHGTSEHDVSSRESAVRIGPIARALEGHLGKFTAQPLHGRRGQVPHLILIADELEDLQRFHGSRWCHSAVRAREACAQATPERGPLRP